jgi:hypothetical protein
MQPLETFPIGSAKFKERMVALSRSNVAIKHAIFKYTISNMSSSVWSDIKIRGENEAE